MAGAGKKLKVFLIVAAALMLVLGGTVAVLVKYANSMIKGQLESRLGKNFSLDSIDLTWGHVEVVGIKLRNGEGKEVIKVGDLSVSADFMGLLRKRYIISSVTIKDPYLFVEIDKRGRIVNPVLPPELLPGGPAGGKEAEQPAPPVFVKKIEVINGSVDYLDRKTPATPVLTEVRTIDFVMKDFSVPFADTFSDYVLSASILGNHGTGTVKSKGRIKIKTKETDLKVDVRKLDITAFKPYFQKESPVDITKGLLDLTMDVTVKSGRLHAPGTVVLSDLQFRSGPGMGGKFMGMPLSLVVALLKKSNNQIPLSFVMEGDLDNPKFDLRENLMKRISVAMADKLGLPLKGITEAVTGVGAKGAEEVGSSVKGVEKGLKKLFQ
jgi:hypothetical protein